MAGRHEELRRKKFGTTKMSADQELKMCDMDNARKGGSPVGGIQQGGVSLSKAGRYPVVLTGIGTALYCKSAMNVQESPGKAKEALDSIPMPKTPADAAAAAAAETSM